MVERVLQLSGLDITAITVRATLSALHENQAAIVAAVPAVVAVIAALFLLFIILGLIGLQSRRCSCRCR